MSCPELSVAVYANADKPEALKVAHELLTGPVGNYTCCDQILTGKIDQAAIKHCQYLIVIGGDGTILSTVRELNGFQIPIIGVNVGKLGFLARFSRDDLACEFENMISHCHNSITDHKLLRCDLLSEGKVKDSSLVVNEVAVVAGPPYRMLDITISIGNEHLSNCSGDGMIISTPT
ncbi:MAG: NAD(+)/NADH kinase, partial [Sedimentisphaerales bacterium]|nr:NAD(+)/NADH kinase [Sedimentisphaerales bacterium]